jgi:V/A-type H+/Na+-transporting ATPase subunit D
MAGIQVNPTRMELTKLKKRLKTAIRGHKLLKDKRDEMIRQFMEIIRRNKILREQVEVEVGDALKSFLLARAAMSPEEIDEALVYPTKEVELSVSEKNIMSVIVPKINVNEKERDNSFLPYGLAFTAAELDGAVNKLSDSLLRMIELAELEKTCNMLADEIEKTRRRVNALEYVMIPEMKDSIKYITMKLDENERGSRTRLMKMKDIISAREA